MLRQKPWVVAILASVAIVVTSQFKAMGAISAIYFDEKGNSHALDETLKNPFDATSKEGKLADKLLTELKNYKLCKIVYDGDKTSSPADLEKKIDEEMQAAKDADAAKKKAISDAEKDFEKDKKQAKKDEKQELTDDEKQEQKDLDNAPKGQKDAVKQAHKENREKIKKKYKNDDNTGIIDKLEAKKKAAIDAANSAAAASLKLECAPSEDCGDKPCKETSLGKDPADEDKLKEAPVPKKLIGIAPKRLFFCACGKK